MLILAGGTPKGGTQYTADLLTACGLPCRRETALRKVPPDRLSPTDCLAESSWLAIPWFPYFDGVKILVARAPLNVIRSQHGSLGFLGSPDDYLCRLFPELLEEHGLRRYARFWLCWMAWGFEHADVVWPLPVDGGHIVDLGERLQGVPPLDPDGVDRVSATVNSGEPKWRKIDTPWHDVTRDRTLMGELETMAGRLGVPLFMA